MASQPPPQKGGGMMSLYANLLDPSSDNSSAPGTISRAPVVFKQAGDNDAQQDDAASKKQQISAASLRFQPTKRPQLASQKAKAKPGVPKAPVIGSAAGSSPVPGSTTKPLTKTTLADWATTADDDDVNGFYGGEKRQRGGRKKRKKNREEETNFQNWDDIYDPSRPNSYEAYRHSEEKIREVREWKDRLYAHRMARRTSSDMDSDEEYSRSQRNQRFAPPLNFAPPPNLNKPPPERQRSESPSEPAPVPSATIPDDATGDDAYTRRLRMSQNVFPPPGASPANISIPPPPPPTSEHVPPPPPNQPFTAATMSRAPVRYTLPPAPEEIPATEAELEATFANEEDKQETDGDAPRSLRPGQKGFAERLLSKYGWTKGSGLGASGEGIVKPLQVKIEKQKKKPDSEGGGFATPAGRAKIIGGNKKQSDEGKFGRMSEVIVLYGMVDGMDLDAELEGGEGGGLMQEIGDECGEKYGRVERVFIDRNSKGTIPVFVKFTSQLSALRAVNALEGRIFSGNTITARFFDVEKFEQGIYE
ncbi:hypothetical protein AJ79_01756 [Helicocarpus griseus UAMH5409]|uniref:G-patch domain-containing protein n=1 Tax=Helicocarpus griseus UAMH5409 TaxID=1447875 RepID=A0A2B7Y5E4_9EURO|nr:hypothetical protein AJ79_01756 [Helicocarpus griseus UAMH5409]